MITGVRGNVSKTRLEQATSSSNIPRYYFLIAVQSTTKRYTPEYIIYHRNSPWAYGRGTPTWGDVVRGSHRLLHVFVLREVLRESEVDELDAGRVSRRLHQPVLELEVTVHDAVAVHVTHLPKETQKRRTSTII